MSVTLSRGARWAVPGTAAVVTAGAIAVFQIPAAQAAPDLPAKTPAQLLASLSSHQKVPPLTGTVVETASLGLPQLPAQAGNPASLTSLLTGNHTVRVYYQDSTHFRLAIPQPQAETDIIADGSRGWLWESASNSVTEFIPPPGTAPAPGPAQEPLTPQQAASQILAKVGKTTVVSDQANVIVAGEPSYQLVLAPRDPRSLVGKVVIALDGRYGVPLRVQLYAKGRSAPAFQVGYETLQWAAPAPANFSFTPPKSASVTVVRAGRDRAASGTAPAASGVGSYGTGWLTVVSFPQKDLSAGFGTASGAASPGQQNAYSAGGNGVSVSSRELLNALLSSAKPVSGSWGRGSLISTSLVSMLITGGEVYAGAVTPDVLYAAVGHTAS